MGRVSSILRIMSLIRTNLDLAENLMDINTAIRDSNSKEDLLSKLEEQTVHRAEKQIDQRPKKVKVKKSKPRPSKPQ